MKAKIVFDMLGPQVVKPTTKGDKDETQHFNDFTPSSQVRNRLLNVAEIQRTYLFRSVLILSVVKSD
jgi:hypothetical protein